jgi:hypothetical protein
MRNGRGRSRFRRARGARLKGQYGAAIKRQYGAAIKLYDKYIHHILVGMADMPSNGIID